MNQMMTIPQGDQTAIAVPVWHVCQFWHLVKRLQTKYTIPLGSETIISGQRGEKGLGRFIQFYSVYRI